MTMNGAVLPVMAFYILAGEEQGVDKMCIRDSSNPNRYIIVIYAEEEIL